MSEQQSWDHKGVTITFDVARASFRFQIDGKNKTAASLDAAKKQIDKAKLNAFVPFRALYLSLGHYKDEIEPPTAVMATAIEQRQGRFSGRGWTFHVEGATRRFGHEHAELYPDTQECRAAFQAYMETVIKNKHARAAMEKEEKRLRLLIPEIRATDYHERGKLVVRIAAKESTP